MSTSSLIIEYRDFGVVLAKRLGPIAAATAVATLPLALFGPYSNTAVNQVWVSFLKIQSPGAGEIIACNCYLIASVAVLLLCLGFRRFLQQTSIIVDPDKIVLPDVFAASMQFRLERSWRDVSNVAVLTKEGKPAQLVIYFRSGGRAAICIDSVDHDDLEKLTVALQMRVEDSQKTAQLEPFLDFLTQNKQNRGQISFTHIWEEDMNQRFTAIAFVPLDPGQTLQSGKIKIVRQIALGGLSAVYLAQRQEGGYVIVKEAALPGSVNPSLKEKAESMLKREADLLMRLMHPQIVKLLDCFLENGKTYLVLEQINGKTLRQIIAEKGPVSETTALDWMQQLAEILSYLHRQDPPIMHKDLSPDNVILNPDGKLVLIDFGIANELISTATGTLAGKRAYVSPEQFKGKATPRSDIYALGATLYFLLTGRDPEPLSESHPREINPYISAGMDELVAQCTSLEEKGRIEIADDLLHAPVIMKLKPQSEPETVAACKQTIN